MSKLFRILLSITLGCAALGGVARAAKTTTLPVPHAAATARRQEQAATRPGASKRGTPLEKVFLPHLQQRLNSAAKSRGNLTATPFDTGVSSSAPNFGGFLNSHNYPGRLESSCIADPYNCGVSAVFAADLDKDGKPDLAVVQSDGNLNVMLNNGSGGFSPIALYTNPNYSSTYSQQSFLADVNNDGYPDIVILNGDNQVFIVYPNLKNGTFGTPTSTSFSTPGNVASAAVGDVNGDGFADIVVASFNAGYTGSSMSVQTFLGSSNLTFQAATDAQTQTYTFPGAPQLDLSVAALALGDLNKDGKLDLALEYWEYTSSGTVVVTTSLGNGDGTFSTLNANATTIGTFQPGIFNAFDGMSQGGLQIADVNNDGVPDITAEGDGVLLVSLGDSSGNVSATVQSSPIGTADQYVFADLNGDGIPDLVQENGYLAVWTGKGDGTFTQPVTGNDYTVDSGGYASAAVADFDGDGKLDVAHLGEDYKQVSIFSGNGTTTLSGAPALASSLVSPPNPFWLYLGTVADVQGKGYSSVVYSDGYTGNLVTGLGDGKGNFTYVTALPYSSIMNLAYVEPIAADLNGDGTQDILLAGADGSLSLAFSNGDGTFQAPQSLGITTTCELSYAAIGDVNGDGIPDIVAPYPGDGICNATVNTGSGYYVLFGKGSGSFAAPVFHAYGTELYSASIVDMNGDGKVDLVVDDTPFYVSGNFSVDLLPGNGDGTFGDGITINANNMVSQVITGDFNGDGKQDVVLLSEGEQSDADAYTTAGILLIPGNGDGTFNVPTQIGTGNFFLNGTLTDVNNDGIPDLNVALYQTIGQPKTYFGLSTLLGTGGGGFSDPINQLESLSSEIVLTGNFYSDNAADLIVQTAYGPALYLGQGGSTIALTNSGAAINFGDTETLTASLTTAMSGRPAPTGTISFYDGTTLLGTTSLTGGTATFATSALATGAHSITAVYTGDSNFNPVTSSAAAVTVTALTPAFTLSSSASTLSLTIGQNGVVTLTLAANAAFGDTINLTCSGAPTNTTCTVNPTSVALTAGGAGTATVVIGTTTNSASNSPVNPLQKASGITSLASVICLIAGWRFRRRMLLIVPVLLLAFSAIAMTGCGSDSSVATAKKGTYTLTVTATPASSATAAQTTTISLTVQ